MSSRSPKNTNDTHIFVLKRDDVATMRSMLAVFAEAFDDETSYTSAQPDDAYLSDMLGARSFVAIAATREETVVGGLVAYVLPKIEQARSEIYIYDLAVAEACRRQGIATTMIDALKRFARERGAFSIYVQADRGDDAAIALYAKLGVGADVLHFDIPLH